MNAVLHPGSREESLELRDVHVTYRRPTGEPVYAVRGVDLRVAPGEIVGLVGESGCGKSSLGRAAVGLEPVVAGSVTIGGRAVEPLGRRRRRADLRGLQLVFQDPYSSLNPRRKVGQQIADGVRASSTQRGSIPNRVGEILDLLGLSRSVAEKFPNELSGGQRQRLAIGRALAVDPTFLVADEPVSALDSSAQASITALLDRLRTQVGLGILFISHDLGIVHELAQRIAVMYLGKIVETGPTAEIWDKPLHPYTQALIGAIPKTDSGGVLPTALAGEVPNPSAPPAGCGFHPRCPIAEPPCSVIDPPDMPTGADRSARCLLLPTYHNGGSQ